ncbi:MAG: hypothetical protein MJ250_02230 [Alphaproteobacteria bacterium]|nr:hypothetical protein [Alphaproteobacteria bacterium]
MMIKRFSVLEILKGTFLFFFNKKVMKNLSLSYLTMSALFACVWNFFPFIQVHENHTLELNIISIGIILSLIGYFSMMIVNRVQQYIFFDKEILYSYFYRPQKDDFKLLICLLKMFCAGIICSYVSVVIFSLLGQKFFNILPLTWVGVIKYTAIFVPYFLILQCYRIPACVAGEQIGFFRGFKKSNQFGMLLCVVYLLISIFPFMIAFFLFAKIQLGEFFSIIFVSFAGFVSVQIQATFMGYMYAILKEGN